MLYESAYIRTYPQIQTLSRFQESPRIKWSCCCHLDIFKYNHVSRIRLRINEQELGQGSPTSTTFTKMMGWQCERSTRHRLNYVNNTVLIGIKFNRPSPPTTIHLLRSLSRKVAASVTLVCNSLELGWDGKRATDSERGDLTWRC